MLSNNPIASPFLEYLYENVLSAKQIVSKKFFAFAE
ncbi:Uncharacterised protein [Mesomycoplasma hyorhinis]|nr:Uncharacterised protein [Mesomycoplasma hyorhinis]